MKGEREAMKTTPSDPLWVGTTKGLCQFDPDKNTFESVNLSSQINIKNNSPNVQVLFEDKKGSLWIGTRDTGYLKLKIFTSRGMNFASGFARSSCAFITS